MISRDSMNSTTCQLNIPVLVDLSAGEPITIKQRKKGHSEVVRRVRASPEIAGHGDLCARQEPLGSIKSHLMLRYERKWGDGNIIDEVEKGTEIFLWVKR